MNSRKRIAIIIHSHVLFLSYFVLLPFEITSHNHEKSIARAYIFAFVVDVSLANDKLKHSNTYLWVWTTLLARECTQTARYWYIHECIMTSAHMIAIFFFIFDRITTLKKKTDIYIYFVAVFFFLSSSLSFHLMPSFHMIVNCVAKALIIFNSLLTHSLAGHLIGSVRSIAIVFICTKIHFGFCFSLKFNSS